MATWTDEELRTIGDADELRIASRRTDGSLRPAVTIWVVLADGALVVRSGFGRSNGWFRRALATHRARIEAGGTARDVRLEEVDPVEHDAADAAYHSKYDRYGPRYVDPVVDPESWTATLRLVPES